MSRSVTNQEVWNFSVAADGLYAITITARCKNWLQNARRRFNDDDLAIQIDDYFFADLKGKKREFNVVGSWNGNELKNAAKAVILILPLRSGEHAMTFWTDKFPWIETIEVVALPSGEQNFTIPIPENSKAVDLILKNVAPTKISVTDQSGAKKPIKLGTDRSLGVRALIMAKPGEPMLQSLNLTISADSIRYQIGRVKLYKDITLSTKINLRAESKTDAALLTELVDGDEVEILDEREFGDIVQNYSNIWHKVRYQAMVGYALSSFIEIQGQEREKIIDLIKAKCIEAGSAADANIMLAIAGVESHFKPYAVSYRGATGIFQLTEKTAEHLAVTDRLDWHQNISGGIRYFQELTKRFTKRGNVLEKRLIAWQSGPGYVSNSAPVDYNKLPYPKESREFVKRVLENIAKKDWRHIILLLIAFGMSGIVFAAGQFMAVRPAFSLTAREIDYIEPASNYKCNTPNTDDAINSLILKSHSDDSPALIVVKGLGSDLFNNQTEFFYCGQKTAERQLLPGYFVTAGWINLDYERKIFWIERSEGKYLPTTFYFYDYLNSHEFKKIKFISKNGTEREEISGPFDILSAAGESILREYLDSDTTNSPVTKVREYQFEFGQNVFRETGISERQIVSPT